MSILKYYLLMQYLKKFNIKMVSYNTFIQYDIKKINYAKLFKDVKNDTDFLLNDIDCFIKSDKKVEAQYNNNIIFQYCYMILSNYIFNDKDQLINIFNDLHKLILNSEYKKIDKMLSSVTRLKKDSNTLYLITEKVNKFINNPKYVSYIEKKLNSTSHLGELEHSNIYEVQNIVASTLKMLFVHNCDIDLDNFLINIKNKSINEYSIDLLRGKCKNSKIDFFHHMLNYYNSRFFYHGTNSKWLKDCRKMGLNGISNSEYHQEISKVIDLFESYGIYKVFENRTKELKGFNYYITDSIDSAVYYAHQSPEYLSRFCANGFCMKTLDDCDFEAFWRRDYKACLNNIQKLCKSVNMRRSETLTVIRLFNALWKKEVKGNQYPIIFIGRMKMFDQNSNKFNEIKQNIDNYSFEDLYKTFTTPSEIHNKRLAPINSEFLSVLRMPNLYSLYKIKLLDSSVNKYIIYNKIKYYPDIVVKNDYYKNLYFILKDIDEVKVISEYIYFIPKEYEKINMVFEDSFYIQNLQYLIITNGKGITEKGKNFIKDSPVSFDSVYKYYSELTKKLINEYFELLEVDSKINSYNVIANNIFYNFYIMNKTHKFPNLVDSGYKSILHYDYDTNNYWIKSKAQNNISIMILDSIIDCIKDIFANL